MKNRFDKNAMTIVSMENPAFDQQYLTSIIRTCERFHSRLFIILADGLYTYNRNLFAEPQNSTLRLKQDRRRYIDNAIRDTSPKSIEIVFKSWQQLCTPRFVDVVRRVYMLVLHDLTLNEQVKSRAAFLAKTRSESARCESGAIALSCAYIVEETAMALYLASKYRVGDEYYPGDDAPVLRTIYELLDTENLYSHLNLRAHEKRFWNVSVNTNRFDRTLEWANASGRYDV